jgi:DNA mismatch repair protein MutH
MQRFHLCDELLISRLVLNKLEQVVARLLEVMNIHPQCT